MDDVRPVVIRRFGAWTVALLLLATAAAALVVLLTAGALRPDAPPGLGPAVRVSPAAPVSAPHDPGAKSSTDGHEHDECDGADAVDPATPPAAGVDDDHDADDADDVED
jgi:hypothetical protein